MPTVVHSEKTDAYHELDLVYRASTIALPAALRERFVTLHLDDETRQFVVRAASRRHGALIGLMHRVLRPFFSDFDINGLLGTYPLYLLSTEQWRSLLGPWAGGRLLDVGAGLGDVTLRLATLFDEVVATETSPTLARRLARRGVSCERVDIASAGAPKPPYDVVSCLNVLDRCDRPRSLLQRAFDAVRPGGVLVIATPLPYAPFVYEGGTTRPPLETLRGAGRSWEESLGRLYHDAIEPLGGSLASVCRAPYLSVGDSGAPLYVLDDAVLLLQKASAEGET